MALLPRTQKKLKGKGRKIIAALSVLAISVFVGALPLLFIPKPSEEVFWFTIMTTYTLVYLVFLPGLVMAAHYLEVDKTLFNDYSNWPQAFHWSVIVLCLFLWFIIIGAKWLVFYDNLRYKN